MKTTGYQLREAIKLKSLELSTVISQFDEALHYFEGETKPAPVKIAGRAQELEDQIVLLQVAQDYFNVHTIINHVISLATCIKSVGGYGRRAKLFREAATGAKRDRWERNSYLTRDATKLIAMPSISKQEALEEAIRYEKLATHLRTQIALANSKVLEIPLLDQISSKELFS